MFILFSALPAAEGQSDGEEPAALFSQRGMQLPMPAPLQTGLPFAPAGIGFNPALAFGPAVFGNLNPAAAAAAAAEAFKNAPHMFASAASSSLKGASQPGMFPQLAVAPMLTPWGFFGQPSAASSSLQQAPALFQPSPPQQPAAAAQEQQQEAEFKEEEASQADTVCAMSSQPQPAEQPQLVAA